MLSYEVSGIAVNGIVHGDFSDWMCANNGRHSLRLDAGVWLDKDGEDYVRLCDGVLRGVRISHADISADADRMYLNLYTPAGGKLIYSIRV